ncbi:MAG: PepSY domain-containing protein [Phenylobacterium sp.]|uniref:PepSY domain-containing protein n=1 Tax=Phenylobacterium sp. TaxID=1871053 RepID=UPI00273280EA|nr:PepSY domain-containing protein [Phenylobacterium sp.]MDP3175096.1 PepSY domain-containing protein [Phenylobacterium sp.]
MRIVALATLSVSAALLASPTLAKDRAPTQQEQAAIEKVLRAEGFVAWEEIEYDDDRPIRQPVWDIDDARTADGKMFDVRLEPGTLKVLRRTADD